MHYARPANSMGIGILILILIKMVIIMKTQISKDNALIIFLNRNEVEALSLDFNNFAASDKQTRFILNSLYNDAAFESGFQPETSDRRLIEILPFENGSCIIIFSFPKKQRFKVTAKIKTYDKLFEFESKDSLYRFIESAKGFDKKHFLALFENSGEYRLLINSNDKSLIRILSEYSEAVKGKYALSSTKEYWNCLYSKTSERIQQPL